jgi:hypothetical protein
VDRRDFYFKQAVSEIELNGAFDAVEQAIWNFIVDMGLAGIASGLVGSQSSPTPNLNVLVSGPGYAFDQAGERIFVPAVQTVNVGQDSNLVPTSVAGAGNEKWVSVFIKFARTLSDPRVDGNSLTIEFQAAESFSFVVVQGAEATLNSATRPTKDPTMLLLFDVHRTFGQAAIVNADIDQGSSLTSRRDDTFVLAQTPIALRAGNMQTSIAAMLQALNNHVLGSAGEHPDTAISSASRSGSPFALSSGSVGDQLTALLSDINATAATYASASALRASTVTGPIAIISWANGGAGLYYYDAASTVADDGFTTIKPTAVSGAGRWRAETATRMVFEHYDDYNGTLVGATFTGVGAQTFAGTGIAFSSVAAGDVIDLEASAGFSGGTGAIETTWVISQTTPSTLSPTIGSLEFGVMAGNPISLAPRGRYVVVAGDVGHTLTAALIAVAPSGASTTGTAMMIRGTQRRGIVSAI